MTAVELLLEALKTIRQPDMMEIGALGDLRTYLGSQESSLADILLEELHNHLYLKSLYCNDRWKAYAAGQKDVTVLASLNADKAGMKPGIDRKSRAADGFQVMRVGENARC